MPSGWRGGRGCQCAGPEQCAHAERCCRREGGPGRQRALKQPGADGKPTLCLDCAGQEQAARPERRGPRRRPAAAEGEPRAKAKAKAKAAAAAPQAAPGAVAPPPAPAAAPADAAALTAHSEALRQHTAALNAWTTAATRLAAALEAAPTTDAPRQLLEDVRRALAALPRGASPGPPAAALLLDPVPLCPEALVRLRAAMDNALAGTSRPQASAILQAAGASGGNAWAKLRALIAVYHGGAGARVLDGDTSLMAERATSAQLAQDWRASGPSQLPTMRLRTGLEAATLLSHVARRMCTDADLRRACGDALLRQAAALS